MPLSSGCHRVLPGLVAVGLLLGSLTYVEQADAQRMVQARRITRPPPPKVYPRTTISFLAGAGEPLSRPGLKDLWLRGPSGSVAVMVEVNPYHAFGIEAEATELYFDRTGFMHKWPGIALQSRNIAFLDASIAWKWTLMPRMLTTPYLGLHVGVARLTGARYQEFVNGLRVTYYDLSGHERLSAGATAGVDITIARWLALEAEAKATAINNDPDVGVMIFLRGGLRLRP